MLDFFLRSGFCNDLPSEDFLINKFFAFPFDSNGDCSSEYNPASLSSISDPSDASNSSTCSTSVSTDVNSLTPKLHRRMIPKVEYKTRYVTRSRKNYSLIETPERTVLTSSTEHLIWLILRVPFQRHLQQNQLRTGKETDTKSYLFSNQ